MCEALRELMKEDLEQREQETLLKAIRNLMETMKLNLPINYTQALVNRPSKPA